VSLQRERRPPTEAPSTGIASRQAAESTLDSTAAADDLLLTESEARELTDGIAGRMSTLLDLRDELVPMIRRARAGQAWRALGHSSWSAYCAANFPMLRLPAGDRQHLVAELAGDGMSQREISAALGASQATVSRDLRGDSNESPAAPANSATPPPLTRAQSWALTEQIRWSIGRANDGMSMLVMEALRNAIPAVEIIAALTRQMRTYERSTNHPHEVANAVRRYFYEPLIDELLDPATTESWRPEWDHETFKPPTEEERRRLLDALAGGGAR